MAKHSVQGEQVTIYAINAVGKKKGEKVQQKIFAEKSVIHWYDKDGALRSGHLKRQITTGRRAGACVVIDSMGHTKIVTKVRNVDPPKNVERL